jgi:hypothetical protein
MLFTETATHIRAQQALQLSLFIEITLRLEESYPAKEEDKESHYVSFLGGYSNNKKALFREIQNEQIKRSPLDILQELEENLNTDYTTTEERFNIKRASSPISLSQRNNKESYSEKTKQKTTFEEKETDKEIRTDRQPRQQNKLQQVEQQAPQRKRRAEISSPERPMSISPSPRRSPPRRTSRRSPSNRRRTSRTPDRTTITRTVAGRSLSRKAISTEIPPPAGQGLPTAQTTTTTITDHRRNIRHRTAHLQQEGEQISTPPAPPAPRWNKKEKRTIVKH